MDWLIEQGKAQAHIERLGICGTIEQYDNALRLYRLANVQRSKGDHNKAAQLFNAVHDSTAPDTVYIWH